jgi:ABC-type ATPase with predicted acetyltransferase domain
MAEAIRLLSIAGLSDAYLYIRNPAELSDGQRYRFRLAKLIEENADVWVADEFGAVLDRVTAKIVAWNLAKTARALGKTLIVATTHTDLVAELAPSLAITKRFHDRIKVEAGSGVHGD